MRALVIYLAFGAVFSYGDHALRYDTAAFWRDLLAWPIVALDKVVDLDWLLTQHGQNYVTLGFAVALIVYALSRFKRPSAKA